MHAVEEGRAQQGVAEKRMWVRWSVKPPGGRLHAHACYVSRPHVVLVVSCARGGLVSGRLLVQC